MTVLLVDGVSDAVLRGVADPRACAAVCRAWAAALARFGRELDAPTQPRSRGQSEAAALRVRYLLWIGAVPPQPGVWGHPSDSDLRNVGMRQHGAYARTRCYPFGAALRLDCVASEVANQQTAARYAVDVLPNSKAERRATGKRYRLRPSTHPDRYTPTPAGLRALCPDRMAVVMTCVVGPYAVGFAKDTTPFDGVEGCITAFLVAVVAAGAESPPPPVWTGGRHELRCRVWWPVLRSVTPSCAVVTGSYGNMRRKLCGVDAVVWWTPVAGLRVHRPRLPDRPSSSAAWRVPPIDADPDTMPLLTCFN